MARAARECAALVPQEWDMFKVDSMFGGSVSPVTKFYCTRRSGDQFRYTNGGKIIDGTLGKCEIHDKGAVCVVKDWFGNEICQVNLDATVADIDSGIRVCMGSSILQVTQTHFDPPPLLS